MITCSSFSLKTIISRKEALLLVDKKTMRCFGSSTVNCQSASRMARAHLRIRALSDIKNGSTVSCHSYSRNDRYRDRSVLMFLLSMFLNPTLRRLTNISPPDRSRSHRGHSKIEETTREYLCQIYDDGTWTDDKSLIQRVLEKWHAR